MALVKASRTLAFQGQVIHQGREGLRGIPGCEQWGPFMSQFLDWEYIAQCSTCLVCRGLWVQSQHPTKKKKKKRRQALAVMELCDLSKASRASVFLSGKMKVTIMCTTEW